MNRFVATCAETRELLSDYVEDELEGRARRRVLGHLLLCRRCRAVLRSLKATIARLNTLDAVEPPARAGLPESVIARVRAQDSDGAAP